MNYLNWIKLSILLSIFMKQVAIYSAPDVQSGMKIIRFLRFGNFMNQVKLVMEVIGIIGEQSKKYNGNIILNYG